MGDTFSLLFPLKHTPRCWISLRNRDYGGINSQRGLGVKRGTDSGLLGLLPGVSAGAGPVKRRQTYRRCDGTPKIRRVRGAFIHVCSKIPAGQLDRIHDDKAKSHPELKKKMFRLHTAAPVGFPLFVSHPPPKKTIDESS